jgi:hypothetical protein
VAKNISVTINRLKISDCADDDEDMDLRLAIYVRRGGQEERVFSKELIDVYVEEEGKIGNDSRCVFFAGERADGLAAVDEVRIDADLSTRDGDGFAWGGHHNHVKNTSGLASGNNSFIEGKAQSSNAGSQGAYDLSYTITVLP